MAGIYIHIPFCKKLCYYCDFFHIISQENNSEFIEPGHTSVFQMEVDNLLLVMRMVREERRECPRLHID